MDYYFEKIQDWAREKRSVIIAVVVALIALWTFISLAIISPLKEQAELCAFAETVMERRGEVAQEYVLTGIFQPGESVRYARRLDVPFDLAASHEQRTAEFAYYPVSKCWVKPAELPYPNSVGIYSKDYYPGDEVVYRVTVTPSWPCDELEVEILGLKADILEELFREGEVRYL